MISNFILVSRDLPPGKAIICMRCVKMHPDDLIPFLEQSPNLYPEDVQPIVLWKKEFEEQSISWENAINRTVEEFFSAENTTN